MKRYLSLFCAAALFITGCGTQSYEQPAELEPLPKPVALAGVIVVPYPTPLPVSLRGTAKMTAIEAAIAAATTTEEAKSWAKQVKAASLEFPQTSADAGDPYISQRRQYFTELLRYLERAAVIKSRQLEAGDTKDSTGEVAKHLTYARITGANANTLPQRTQ